MRKPLRYTIDALTAAGLRVDRVYQAGKHTEIHLENGGLIRLSRGNHPSRAHERRLRTFIRRHSEAST